MITAVTEVSELISCTV